MKKLSYLSLIISLLVLTGCGGSSNSSSTTNNSSNNNSSGETTNNGSTGGTSGGSTGGTASPTPTPPPTTCERGVLVNSQLNTPSIFNERLYRLDHKYNGIDTPQIYAHEYTQDGQMLYAQFNAIFNVTVDELDRDEQEYNLDAYILNSTGIYTQAQFKKQNLGWPVNYISTSSDSSVTMSMFNDSCNFSADKRTFTYEKVDLSGLKIADILPTNNEISKYIPDSVVYILETYPDSLKALSNSDLRFPSGSFVYVPKSITYDENQFFFWESSVSEHKTLDEWYQDLYGNSGYSYKKDQVAGYDVIYSINKDGNAAYISGADPAIEKNGKIYDGEWEVKGDILSANYGGYNYPNEFTAFNKTGFDFIKQQIQTYYK